MSIKRMYPSSFNLRDMFLYSYYKVGDFFNLFSKIHETPVLGKLKVLEAIPVLIKPLLDKELYGVVASASQIALEEIGEEDVLITHLMDENLCRRIAWVLGRLKKQKTCSISNSIFKG